MPTSWNRAGKTTRPPTRATATVPSSSGCRSASSTGRGNSGSSSSSSTPRCASVASPGRGVEPPPTTAAVEAVWCGARNGGVRSSPAPGGSSPATEWMRVTSSASSSSSRGRIPGSRRASIVFPIPGGPASSRLCAPAAAISSARRARSWPRTSARSGAAASRIASPHARAPARAGRARRGSTRPPRARCSTATGSTPASATSGARLRRTDEPPRARAPRSLRGDERARDRSQPPVEGELADRGVTGEAARWELPRRRQHRERDRKVEARALLAQVGRREVDDDPARAATRAPPTRSRCGRAPSPPGTRGRRGRRSRTPARRAGGAPRPRPGADRARRARG